MSNVTNTSIFSIRDKKVVLNTHVLLIPEFKAIVEAYPEDHLNVLAFVNYMTNPNKDENPYIEFRENDRIGKLLRDFPTKSEKNAYTERTPVVRAAIDRMREDFIDLPEDRLYSAAKQATENLEFMLKNLKIDTLNDVKTVTDILLKIDKVAESLSKTREARVAARSATNIRGKAVMAYDMV